MRVEELFEAIVVGHPALAQSLVKARLGAGADPMLLISETMIPAMIEVGHLYQEEEYFVREIVLSSRAMTAAMEPLRPLLANTGASPMGVVVTGAVKGDIHDIGKTLVISMLEGAGFRVIDLGVNVKPSRFVEAIREHRPQIVCLSALLTAAMMSMRATIQAIDRAGLRDSVKILVGGAPVNHKFAQEIGADGYGYTAADAVTLALAIVAPSAVAA